MDLVLGKAGYEQVTLLNAPEFMNALQKEYARYPAQGWTKAFAGHTSIDAASSAVHDAWADCENRVFDLRQRQTPLLSLYSASPRKLRSAEVGMSMNEQVKQLFANESPGLPSPSEELFYTPRSSFSEPATKSKVPKQVHFNIEPTSNLIEEGTELEKTPPSNKDPVSNRPYLQINDTEQHTNHLLKDIPGLLKGDPSQRLEALLDVVKDQMTKKQGAVTPQMIVLIKMVFMGLDQEGMLSLPPISLVNLREAIKKRFPEITDKEAKAIHAFVRSAVSMGRLLRQQLNELGSAQVFPARFGPNSPQREALLILASAPLEFYAQKPAPWEVKVRRLDAPQSTVAQLFEILNSPEAAASSKQSAQRTFTVNFGDHGAGFSDMERDWILGPRLSAERKLSLLEMPVHEIDSALESLEDRLQFLKQAGSYPEDRWESRAEMILAERFVMLGLNSQCEAVGPDLSIAHEPKTIARIFRRAGSNRDQKNTVRDSHARWREHAKTAIERLSPNSKPEGSTKALSLQAKAVLLLGVIPSKQLFNPSALLQGISRVRADGDREAVQIRDLIAWAHGEANAARSNGELLTISPEVLAELHNASAGRGENKVASNRQALSAIAGQVGQLAQQFLGLSNKSNSDKDLVPSASIVISRSSFEHKTAQSRERVLDWLEASEPTVNGANPVWEVPR
ncbi:MAG: hypothetical protein AB1516_12715 [Pseudomonadota bacterium]